MLAEVESSLEDFTPRDFRDALSSFATGVTIVTTQGLDGDSVGMTASSFNSVSTEPPLILWSVTKVAHSADSFTHAKHFSVHVLATDQTDLSNRFAISGADKFSDTEFQLDDRHVPLIAGCATRFDCSTWAVHEGGDHWIIIGLVNSIERAKKEGLVFGGGAYAVASPLTTPSHNDLPLADGESAIENMLFYHLSRAYHQMGHQFHGAVRNSGLTLAEWRILANLHGEKSLSWPDLAARTFLDPQSLSDLLISLQNEGLCDLIFQQDIQFARGTTNGTERVEKLFSLGRDIENHALALSSPKQRDDLILRLKEIVSNTEKSSRNGKE